MSKTPSFDRFRVQLADWVAQQTAPNTGVGNVAPLGSLCPEVESSQAHFFLKTGAGKDDAVGWTRQNLVNLKIFNVVTQFGAVPDGVTDCRTAIAAAIAAAVANGGGIIYFPIGQYALYKPSAGLFVSFDLANKPNLVFMGDGYKSQLLMIGNAFAGDWYMFRLRNTTTRCKFLNLYFDASRTTNPDPAGQQHTIQIEGNSADPLDTGASANVVSGCFFDYQIGDHVRLFGNGARVVRDNLVKYNAFIATSIGVTGTAKFRSAVGFQRNVSRTSISYNYIDGSSDNSIDYEPTGNGENSRDLIIGNQINGNLRNAQAITFDGTGFDNPVFEGTLAFNIIFNGSSVSCNNALDCTWLGNVVVNQNNSVAATEAAFEGFRVNTRVSVTANVFVTTATALERAALQFAADTFGTATDCLIDGNVLRSERSNQTLFLESATGISVVGNLVTGKATDTINGAMVIASTDLDAIDNMVFAYNTAVPDTGASPRAPFVIAAPVDNVGNVLLVGNYGRNDGGIDAGVQWRQDDPAIFTRYHGTIGNLFIGGTSLGLAFADSMNTMAIGGNAGPGGQVAITQTAAGPLNVIAAAAGSLCSNPAGAGDSAILFYKESGTGLVATGWLRVGTTDVMFGCADVGALASALFMATSSDLPVASSTVEFAFRVWKACTVRNMRVHQTPGTGAGNITYTVRKNGVNTSVASTFAFTGAGGNSGGASVKFAAGDLLSVQITKTQVPVTDPANAIATIELA